MTLKNLSRLRRLALVLCLLAWPCNALARALTITDDLGRSVTLAGPAERVIALYGAFNELVLALDAGLCLAARTAADNDLPELAALPVIGTHMRPNPELIAAQKPDVILQLAGRQEAQIQTEALRSLGLNVLTFTLDSFEDMFRVTRALGRMLSRDAEAGARVNAWRERLAALKEKRPDREPVSVFYEVRYPNLLAAGARGIVQDIIVAAGGVNVTREAKKLVRVNEEALLLAEPELYIIQKGPMNPDAPPPETRPHYKYLSAVRAGRVLYVEERRYARPGPRAIEAAEELSRHFLKVAPPADEPLKQTPP